MHIDVTVELDGWKVARRLCQDSYDLQDFLVELSLFADKETIQEVANQVAHQKLTDNSQRLCSFLRTLADSIEHEIKKKDAPNG